MSVNHHKLDLKDKGSRLQVILAGGIAGLVSRFCIAPIDVLKISLQLQAHTTDRNVNGALYIIKNILRDEGIRGFWKGNVAAELLYVTYGMTQFSIYRITADTLQATSAPTPVASLVSGALAGAVATSLTYPLDVLRTRFAAQGNIKVYTSLASSIRIIARDEGARGFFQGLGAGLGQIVPYMGLFFSTYESLRPPLAALDLPLGSEDAVAGIFASIIAKTGVFPLDLIRKRLQIQGPTRALFASGLVPEYRNGIWSTARAIAYKEGWRGLYKGLVVSLVKAAPASAVTMWTFEQALKGLQYLEVSI